MIVDSVLMLWLSSGACCCSRISVDVVIVQLSLVSPVFAAFGTQRSHARLIVYASARQTRQTHVLDASECTCARTTNKVKGCFIAAGVGSLKLDILTNKLVDVGH
jgi:hypothetical protein